MVAREMVENRIYLEYVELYLLTTMLKCIYTLLYTINIDISIIPVIAVEFKYCILFYSTTSNIIILCII